MSRNLSFHELALEEIETALTFYAEQAAGLAELLATELAAAYALIQQNPAQYREHEPGVRKMKTRPRFNFHVFFEFDDKSIRILAVRHTSRKPVSFRERLADDDTNE